MRIESFHQPSRAIFFVMNWPSCILVSPVLCSLRCVSCTHTAFHAGVLLKPISYCFEATVVHVASPAFVFIQLVARDVTRDVWLLESERGRWSISWFFCL